MLVVNYFSVTVVNYYSIIHILGNIFYLIRMDGIQGLLIQVALVLLLHTLSPPHR